MIDANKLKVGDILWRAGETDCTQVRVKSLSGGRGGLYVWVVDVVSDDYDPGSFNPPSDQLYVDEVSALEHTLRTMRARIAQMNIRLYHLDDRRAALRRAALDGAT